MHIIYSIVEAGVKNIDIFLVLRIVSDCAKKNKKIIIITECSHTSFLPLGVALVFFFVFKNCVFLIYFLFSIEVYLIIMSISVHTYNAGRKSINEQKG